jgi:hypothetical protein
MYKKILAEINPSEASAKITYGSTFDPNFCLMLRERRATTLAHIQDAAVEVESNILVVDRLKSKADRDIPRGRVEASSSYSYPLPPQMDEVTKVLKSLSARMERWELEGKPVYRNPYNTDNKGFRRPCNNVPQVSLREKRSRDRYDQRIQTPLQRNMVPHEEGEEIKELDPKIH